MMCCRGLERGAVGCSGVEVCLGLWRAANSSTPQHRKRE